jgi:putative ATP-dependent endonuclease of OLD family
MRLSTLRLCKFQSFGPKPVLIQFEPMTFLIGPNGAGKTAVLQALARLFAFDPTLRRIQPTDFHASAEQDDDHPTETMELWIEAEFEFPELQEEEGYHPTIPSHFAHMRLESRDGMPLVRFRLNATMDSDGDIEDQLLYVLTVDKDGNPGKTAPVSKYDRSEIHMHYLPARRDPTDHIAHTANSLLGRALRAANWQVERASIAELTEGITGTLAGNAAVGALGQELTLRWSVLHRGAYFANPKISFVGSDMDRLLRYLTVNFAPGHHGRGVDFSRMSDGQKSLLYLSIVLTVQAIGHKVLVGTLKYFAVEKLRPAVYTLVAMEEPENSLSPHYLGRIVGALTNFANAEDAQAIVATHSPSALRRVAPERIRYLRLDGHRNTVVSSIRLPAEATDAHKFVREAVQSFPELYFSRLVILGEGDSEEVVVPKLLHARGMGQDDAAISVVPLGGRHVNHFWRLLHNLGIPHLTLLDLDIGRYQGGWGRIRYAAQQLLKLPTFEGAFSAEDVGELPEWDSDDFILKSATGVRWIKRLEAAGVFFSSPLDLDFALMLRFGNAYGVRDEKLAAPKTGTITGVLGRRHGDASQYDSTERRHFLSYYRLFVRGSKPTAHLAAMSTLSNRELRDGAPDSLTRLVKAARRKLKELPE